MEQKAAFSQSGLMASLFVSLRTLHPPRSGLRWSAMMMLGVCVVAMMMAVTAYQARGIGSKELNRSR
jgi:hypothetical protein